MPSVNETVRESILRAPSLYGNRTDVLHFILCVLGNGYRWDDNGDVVVSYDEPREHWSAEQALSRFDSQWGRTMDGEESVMKELIADIRKNFIENRLNVYRNRVSDVDHLMNVTDEVISPYPQSEYSILMTIPDNASPDWLEECNKMRVAMIQHGWVF